MPIITIVTIGFQVATAALLGFAYWDLKQHHINLADDLKTVITRRAKAAAKAVVPTVQTTTETP